MRVRDQGAERVVVAEPYLIGHHGVVLVDHRDHAQLEQRAQRRARVQVTLAVGHVGMRQQHLRGVQAVAAEAALVALHQAHLPHRSRRLQLMHGARPPRPAQALHALGDRAARHQYHPPAQLAQRRDLRRPARDRGGIQASTVVRDEGGADLHHQRLCLRDHFLPSSRAIAFIRAAHPFPLIAATLNHGRFQRNARSIAATRASAPSTASLLLKTSQRGLR
jgi:hypothetical protein